MNTHGLVGWVNKDNFVVLVDTILVDPVGVQDPQVSATTTNTLLCGTPQPSLELEVVDTLTNRLAIGSTC